MQIWDRYKVFGTTQLYMCFSRTRQRRTLGAYADRERLDQPAQSQQDLLHSLTESIDIMEYVVW